MPPMRWALSDGTTVTSDGAKLEVSGESAFAEHLRSELASGERILVPEGAAPSQMPLDPARAINVDAWIDDQLRWESSDVVISSRPEFEPAPPEPADDSDPAKVY